MGLLTFSLSGFYKMLLILGALLLSVLMFLLLSVLMLLLLSVLMLLLLYKCFNVTGAKSLILGALV